MEQNNSELAFIFKRSFLGFFWVIVFIPLFIAYFVFKSASPETLASYNVGVENPYIMGGIIFYGIIGIIYSFITHHTKYIERVIRLMSDDNGKKMMPKQSLLLSKKIFNDSAKFKFVLFLKYYWFIALIYVIAFIFALSSLYKLAVIDNSYASQTVISFVVTAFVILFGWIYIHFFLAAKTRFVWFTYVAHFGELFSSDEIFNEVKRLNDVDPKDDKEVMIGYFKRDMSADAGSAVAGSSIHAVVPKGLGSDILGGYSKGMISDIAEYSKIQLNFKQYVEAYKKLFGKNPELSKRLLDL